MGGRRRGDGPLSRRRVGCAGPRRPAALRVPHSRVRASGAELGDDSQEARGVSPGVRRLRCGAGRPVQREPGPKTPRQRVHREEPREDRGHGRQRARVAQGAAGARQRRRLDLAPRGRLAAAERVDVAAAGARRDRRRTRAQPGLEGARLQVRGADDLLRVHAGDGDGERSHDGLLPVAAGPPTREERAMTMALGVLALLLTIAVAEAGGSNYGIAPGARVKVEGRISEWAVPTPQFARDPAPGPDGNIYIAVMFGNRIVRFDTRAKTFTEWELPPGARPHGLLVDRAGRVWYTGNGNGTIGHLDPGTGKVIEHKAPSGGDPHTLVIDETGVIWFTVQNGQRIGRLDTRTGAITEYKAAGNPYGLALDRAGNVWFCQLSGDRLGRLEPKTGMLTDMPLERGSRPRRMATAPDGSLWVTQYGNGKLIRVDPVARKVVKEYALPAGPDGGPYAVTVDGAGAVWANEIKTDTVVRLDPKTDQ